MVVIFCTLNSKDKNISNGVEVLLFVEVLQIVKHDMSLCFFSKNKLLKDTEMETFVHR